MQWWQALVVGLVQGVTEFLPVSSSGHLALTYHFLGLQETVYFTVILHAFTILAVAFYFRRRILELSLKNWMVIALASIPAGIVGLLIKDWIDTAFSSLLLVGLLFCVTGLANIVSNHILDLRKASSQEKYWQYPKWWQALAIGLAQAIAILPGVSRSGMTVAAGLLVGGKRQDVFAFSFLLSLPAVIGAFGLELMDVGGSEISGIPMMWLFAGLVAFLSGILSLKLLALSLQTSKFVWFGIYVFVLSIVVVSSQLL